MSMAQVWLQRAGIETGDGTLPSAAAACSAALRRMPRALFEYQP